MKKILLTTFFFFGICVVVIAQKQQAKKPATVTTSTTKQISKTDQRVAEKKLQMEKQAVIADEKLKALQTAKSLEVKNGL